MLRTLCVLLIGLLISAPSAAQQKNGRPRSILRIYVGRHGQTDWNLEGRTQGGTDIPLNATGRQQAEQLGTRLKGVELDAVYSSPLRRSRETAEIVHGRTPLFSLTGLAERRFGKFEGRLTSDPQDGPELQRRQWTPDDGLDGGESLNDLKQRVRVALETIRKQHPSGSVLIVGHGFTNRIILGILLDLTFDQLTVIDQSNDELYMIELETAAPPHLWKLITETNLKDL